MTPEELKTWLDAWIVRYVKQDVNFRPGNELPSNRLNELFNLLIAQGDDTVQTVEYIRDYLITYNAVTEDMLNEAKTHLDVVGAEVRADKKAIEDLIGFSEETLKDAKALDTRFKTMTYLQEDSPTVWHPETIWFDITPINFNISGVSVQNAETTDTPPETHNLWLHPIN